MQFKVFHLDDDPIELKRVQIHLKDYNENFFVTSFTDDHKFIQALTKQDGALIALLDVHLGAKKSISLIPKILTMAPKATVIIYSQDITTIKEALEAGAHDFVMKRLTEDELGLRLKRTFHSTLARQTKSLEDTPHVVGATMQKIAQRINNIVHSAVRAVHVFGETGTGKEVVADLFRSGLSRGTPFIKVNCGAIAPNLLESELFGHIKGSFTGAIADRVGYIEAASGGWIFLDEIASLPITAQVALLRVIDEQVVLRVGEHKPRQINVRFISATNEPLETLVKQGRFRQDLRQRLTETLIELPTLRSRPKEIGELIDFFCRTERGGPFTIAKEAKHILLAMDWQEGNVRELRNCIRAMTERHVDKELMPRSIPERILAQAKASTNGSSRSSPIISLPFDQDQIPTLKNMADLLAVQMISLHVSKGLKTLGSVAHALGIPKSTLVTKIKSFKTKGLIKSEHLDSFATLQETDANES